MLPDIFSFNSKVNFLELIPFESKLLLFGFKYAYLFIFGLVLNICFLNSDLSYFFLNILVVVLLCSFVFEIFKLFFFVLLMLLARESKINISSFFEGFEFVLLLLLSENTCSFLSVFNIFLFLFILGDERLLS